MEDVQQGGELSTGKTTPHGLSILFVREVGRIRGLIGKLPARECRSRRGQQVRTWRVDPPPTRLATTPVWSAHPVSGPVNRPTNNLVVRVVQEDIVEEAHPGRPLPQKGPVRPAPSTSGVRQTDAIVQDLHETDVT